MCLFQRAGKVGVGTVLQNQEYIAWRRSYAVTTATSAKDFVSKMLISFSFEHDYRHPNRQELAYRHHLHQPVGSCRRQHTRAARRAGEVPGAAGLLLLLPLLLLLLPLLLLLCCCLLLAAAAAAAAALLALLLAGWLALLLEAEGCADGAAGGGARETR
jgi:hypothetical protein